MSMFSKKHYEAIATALREAKRQVGFRDADCVDGIDLAAEYLADTLGKDNPKFNCDKFLTAAGYGKPIA